MGIRAADCVNSQKSGRITIQRLGARHPAVAASQAAARMNGPVPCKVVLRVTPENVSASRIECLCRADGAKNEQSLKNERG